MFFFIFACFVFCFINLRTCALHWKTVLLRQTASLFENILEGPGVWKGGGAIVIRIHKFWLKNSALSINIAPFSVIIIILDILVSRTWLIRKEIAADIFSKIILLFNTLINLLMLVHSSAGLRIRKISNFTCMYVCHERQFVAVNIHALRHLWSWKKCIRFQFIWCHSLAS